MRTWGILVVAVCLGCSGGENNEPSNNTTQNNGVNNTETTGANNTTATNGANNTTATNGANNTTATNGANNTTATNGANNTTATNGSQDLIMPCEGLAFNDSCTNPNAAAGYSGCSDYFGDSSVEVTCGANPNNVFSTSPCPAPEHYVGSCVYYVEELPDNCYITHVAADTADGVQAGKDFWSANCANWIDGP